MLRRRVELALCLGGLTLLTWAPLLAAEPKAVQGAPAPAAPPAAPAPPAPGLSGLTLALECGSFETDPREMGGDCQSGPILIKKAFFDRPLAPKLMDKDQAGADLPVLGTKILLYRRATPKEGGPSEALSWSYRGLIFWSLRQSAAASPAGRGFVDVDSGRRFEGPRGRGYKASDLRTEILRTAAAELAERMAAPLRDFAAARATGSLMALPRVRLEKLPALQGACRTWLGAQEMEKSIQGVALEAASATLARPELAPFEGPWSARVKPCTSKSDEFVLVLEGKRARAEAACPVRDLLLAGESTGILGQCAILWLDGLRSGFLDEYAKSKR